MKVRAAFAFIIAVLFQALVAVADPPGPPGFATPTPVASPAASPSPAPNSTQWTVDRTAIGQVLDQLTDKMFGIFRKFTDKSVQLAQTLFIVLAGLELGWTLVRWMVSQVPLEEYVANSFFKIVQMSLMFIVISNSYSSPFGAGWFMMIVNGIVGMAQDTAGFNVVGTSDSGQFTPIITPGTIMDIGFRLFTLIMQAASSGVNGWNLLTGMTNGATLIYFGTWCFCLVSAVFAVCTMGWIAFRWLWVTMKALWLGAMLFLTGFTGSRVTASIGYGPFNGAFNVGIEMAAHVVIIGLFYPIITSYAGSIGFSEALKGVPGYSGPTLTAAVPMVIQIGAVLLLDVGLALWTYAIKRAPDLAQFAISGAIRLNEKDMLEGVKSESGVLNAGATAARIGAGGIAGMTGGGGDGEGQPSLGDRASGAVSGAIRGGLMAGPEGAIAGAAMGAATAKPSKSEGEGKDQGSVQGGGGVESAVAEGAAAEAGGATGSFTGGFVAPPGKKKPGEAVPGGGEGVRADAQAGGASTADAATSSGGGEAADVAAGGGDDAGGPDGVRRARTARGGGTDVHVERQPDRVSQSGGGGGADAAGAADDASEAQQGFESQGGGGARSRPRRGARVAEASVAAATGAVAVAAATMTARGESSGGSGGSGQGSRASTGGAEAGSAQELTAALRENTAALRAHRFGGPPGGSGSGSSRGGSSAGSGSGSSGSGSSGAGAAGGPNGGGSGGGSTGSGSSGGGQAHAPGQGGPMGSLLGGGNPMNPINMMLYRQLLTAGQRNKPQVNNERPAVSLGVTHIE
jgi:hypothetical protein